MQSKNQFLSFENKRGASEHLYTFGISNNKVLEKIEISYKMMHSRLKLGDREKQERKNDRKYEAVE